MVVLSPARGEVCLGCEQLKIGILTPERCWGMVVVVMRWWWEVG